MGTPKSKNDTFSRLPSALSNAWPSTLCDLKLLTYWAKFISTNQSPTWNNRIHHYGVISACYQKITYFTCEFVYGFRLLFEIAITFDLQTLVVNIFNYFWYIYIFLAWVNLPFRIKIPYTIKLFKKVYLSNIPSTWGTLGPVSYIFFVCMAYVK